jgi:hypothetical protein
MARCTVSLPASADSRLRRPLGVARLGLEPACDLSHQDQELLVLPPEVARCKPSLSPSVWTRANRNRALQTEDWGSFRRAQPADGRRVPATARLPLAQELPHPPPEQHREDRRIDRDLAKLFLPARIQKKCRMPERAIT